MKSEAQEPGRGMEGGDSKRDMGPGTWDGVGAKFNASLQEAGSPEQHLISRTVQACGEMGGRTFPWGGDKIPASEQCPPVSTAPTRPGLSKPLVPQKPLSADEHSPVPCSISGQPCKAACQPFTPEQPFIMWSDCSSSQMDKLRPRLEEGAAVYLPLLESSAHSGSLP